MERCVPLPVPRTLHAGRFFLVQSQVATELQLKLHFFQPIDFPGLDERERVHFLCALRRLNTIAEVQVHTDNCTSHIIKHFSLSPSETVL